MTDAVFSRTLLVVHCAPRSASTGTSLMLSYPESMSLSLSSSIDLLFFTSGRSWQTLKSARMAYFAQIYRQTLLRAGHNAEQNNGRGFPSGP